MYSTVIPNYIKIIFTRRLRYTSLILIFLCIMFLLGDIAHKLFRLLLRQVARWSARLSVRNGEVF